MQTITPEGIDFATGTFTIVTREIDDDGTITDVHRAPVVPAVYVEGTWQNVDPSKLPPTCAPIAFALWTADTIARYQAAHDPSEV